MEEAFAKEGMTGMKNDFDLLSCCYCAYYIYLHMLDVLML